MATPGLPIVSVLKDMKGFVISDEILAPKTNIVLEYFGEDPFRVYSRIPRLMQEIFHARGESIYEDDFRWDITSDPRQFFFIFRVERGVDGRTKYVVILKAFGRQPSDPASKNGKMLVEIKGYLVTIYPIKKKYQRALFWPFIYLYHWAFYNKIRRRYLEIYKGYIEELETELRKILGLPIRVVETV